ncbi:ribosomal protein L7/L12 [Rubripirellula sp.]|nr:ribosomal protein L7/L12 [Rubripirellula sp.]MDB4338956.1 ribosomal protein L7/L12 [Rubripirellula sp.]
MEAKKMVEGVPATLKEAVSKEEADKVKAEVEEAGGSVELK